MSIVAVGDPLVTEAFELVGITSRVPAPGQDVPALLTSLARSGKAQLLLVQSSLAAQVPDELVDQLARKFACLVLEIPGVGDAVPDSSALRRTVHRAIGVVP